MSYRVDKHLSYLVVVKNSKIRSYVLVLCLATFIFDRFLEIVKIGVRAKFRQAVHEFSCWQRKNSAEHGILSSLLQTVITNEVHTLSQHCHVVFYCICLFQHCAAVYRIQTTRTQLLQPLLLLMMMMTKIMIMVMITITALNKADWGCCYNEVSND